ncbi:uncharacterized protein SPAPADRAFT_53929 [Spathaspora passalidarum NRRL Y-27907]|uniref:GYF domain-containing protein n=1 Tax=Spathaspora passalidarum (strain NRRL Y-27907 / 11-Y1) TaxID=619300 RepID=G3AET9_SPAPN|nr:uncharacterized protein SPAPADRAFT_53929 [Spathaspora passalidarum NRRL Y-27907]EGW35769.1 hypothetical protein SPAPADRAFT_53929 [Spathaspora passalidarum NRRL Y-27907]
MYSRPRRNQSLDHQVNNGLDSHESPAASYTPTPTIQPNKGSKRYSMNEVFQVWYDNKDQILNPAVDLPIKASESYRLAKPSQIYHLDLQPSSFDDVHHQEQVNESLDKLSIDDYAEQASQQQSQQQQQQQQQSDLANAASHLTGPPPGISENVLSREQTNNSNPLVTSDKIEWYYIDPLGTEQGPFNGDMMQEWLTGGYLTLDLKIRRKEESTFKTLKDLCDSVQNYIQPFKVPLPDLTFIPAEPSAIDTSSTPTSQFFQNQLPDSLPSQQPQSQFHHHFLPEGNLGPGGVRLPGLSTGPQSGLFANDWKNDPFSPITPSSATATFPATAPVHGHHPHVQQHHHFGIETFNHPFGSTHPLQHSAMPSLLQPQIQQPLSGTGWGLDTSNTSTLISSSNPATPVNPVMVPQPAQVTQPTPISPWISSNVQSSSRVSSPFAPSSSLHSSNSKGPSPLLDTGKEASTGDDTVLDEIHNVVTGILDEEVAEPKDQVKEVKKVETEPDVKPEPIPEPVEPEVVAEEESPEEEEEVSQDSEEEENQGVQLKPAVPQELAPWASKPQETKPKLSLKEIQQMEAEKLERQKRIEAQIRSEQAKAWASLDEPQPAEKAVPAFPATWASAEIHREEAEAAAKAKAAAVAAAASAAAKPSTGAASVTLPVRASLASTLANAVPKDEGPAWTTVTSKKLPVVKKATPVVTNSATKTNPQLLRAVSAAKPAAPSVNANAVREDFLVWARSNMSNLYPSVTKDDLLDIFITLPSNSTDSVQLISETIYSSSATMDGRRFAQEFMKRRQKVDQTIGYAEAHDQVAWASAVISSADKVQTVDEDGWSTVGLFILAVLLKYFRGSPAQVLEPRKEAVFREDFKVAAAN